MKEFIIPFFGLKIGIHQYMFDIGQTFFEEYDSDLIGDGHFKVVLDLEKSTNMLLLDFRAEGEIEDFCDRCGDPLTLAVKTQEHVVVKFGDEAFEHTDEIIILPHEAHEIDISQLIYEMLVLGTPQKKVHEKKKNCNQEVLSRLKSSDEEEDKTDPRWDILKNLK